MSERTPGGAGHEDPRARRRGTALRWLSVVVALAAVAVVTWVAVTAWGAVVHGHPLYAVLLAVTAVVALLLLAASVRALRRPRPPRRVWRGLLASLGLVAVLLWVAVLGWLRPFEATTAATTAMVSGDGVTVTETATQIALDPTGPSSATAVLFQPGARVEARAYAAVLRPLAEAGHPVIIVKQPLGIAFTATGAFEDVRASRPQAERWVVGGHSLGGPVAAMDADAHDEDDRGGGAPVTGLLLYASYPASDLSRSLDADVLSVSGTRDGLATPADVEASRPDLPAGTSFVAVEGAVHAFFGDYGPQPGDGTPSIGRTTARAEIAEASVAFVDAQDR